MPRRTAVQDRRYAEGLCVQCGQRPYREGLQSCAECASKQAKHHHRYWEKLIHELGEHYGHVCVCCGEDNQLFLTLGRIDAESVGNVGGHMAYRRLRREGWPEGYQRLCANCSLGKQRNGGICPHILTL